MFALSQGGPVLALAFGIGTTEIFVVVVLALILFSPRELPGIIRSVMKFWGSIKRTADEFKDTLMQEEALQEIREVYDGTKGHIRKAETDARRELMKARTEMRKAQGKLAKVAKVREGAEKKAKQAAAAAVASAKPEATSDTAKPPFDGPNSDPAAAAPVASAAPSTPAPAKPAAKPDDASGTA